MSRLQFILALWCCGALCYGDVPVDLGTASSFAILAQTGISNVPNSDITGDIGVSPIAATAISGFSLIADSSNVFSTSSQVRGKVYAADYAPPTPDRLTTAIGDMGTAFTDAAGRAPGTTELGAGDIGGMTLGPGVYKWSSGLLVPADITLVGSSTDVWIFQIAQGLTFSSGVHVVLSGAALAKNIFWQVSGAVTLNTGSHVEGVILCKTAIAMTAGASVTGRLMAQTAVTLIGNTVTAESSSGDDANESSSDDQSSNSQSSNSQASSVEPSSGHSSGASSSLLLSSSQSSSTEPSSGQLGDASSILPSAAVACVAFASAVALL